MAYESPSATVVVPAHNEESGLRRLLPALLGSAEPGEFRVIVVCNGCTDGSADEAARHGDDVEVIELAEASKAAALEAGGALVESFPVVYVDADVALDATSLRALVSFVGHEGIVAAGPVRRQDRAGVSLAAGWYYDVWERLPQVRTGLFGRGVIAVSEQGFTRVRALPRYISDDLAFSEAFEPSERGIAEDAVVTVWPARTWRALLKRRIRVVQGNRELGKDGLVSDSASTGIGDLVALGRAEPRLILRLPVFVATAVIARAAERMRRGDRSTWHRDETSRTA
ncbi:glycosyltransferase [Leifsonia sp. NPDC058230]|uniref:glycosyltransferase n=1 Tax=Leifsonia sp. NPDC058230 TaxID=3346391 RepID=UPI0036DDB0EF